MKLILQKIVFFSALLGIAVNVYGQGSNNEQLLHNSSDIRTVDLRSKDIVGTNYITKEYLPANLFDKDEVYSVRFDAYQDEMEVRNGEKARYLIKTLKSTVKVIGVDKLYQVYSNPDNSKIKNGYFVVLFKGDKFSLLLKETIILNEEIKPKTGYDKYVPPTLKRSKDKYFIGYKNFTTKELPRKKKDILAIFSSKSKEVEKYAKSNKLSFKKQEGLIEIFKYYNSL